MGWKVAGSFLMCLRSFLYTSNPSPRFSGDAWAITGGTVMRTEGRIHLKTRNKEKEEKERK